MEIDGITIFESIIGTIGIATEMISISRLHHLAESYNEWDWEWLGNDPIDCWLLIVVNEYMKEDEIMKRDVQNTKCVDYVHHIFHQNIHVSSFKFQHQRSSL